jgi:hypothetical protein
VCIHLCVYHLNGQFADYEWLELWKAIIAVLGFLAGKLDHLTTTGGVENLIQEVGDESD